VYAEILANIVNVTLDRRTFEFIVAGDFNCSMDVGHLMFSTLDKFNAV
jgi:hypothetical protein